MTTSVTPQPIARPAMNAAGLITVVLVAFIGQVDMFIINVAAPAIQRDLDATFAQLQFVITSYIIVYASGMVVGGRAGDRWGHRRAFEVGVLAFAAASALCAAAPTASTLIAARAVQGAAAAAMMPQVLSLLHTHFTGAARPRAVSAYGASMGLGVIAGLIGGGLIMAGNIADLGWRNVFLINIPICLAILIGSRLWVPADTTDRAPVRLDLAGALLVAIFLPLLLAPLTIGPTLGWPLWTWCALAGAAAALTGLVAHQRMLERHDGDPIIAPSMFGRPGFALCMAMTTAFFAGNAGLFLILTYHLQDGLAVDALTTGLVFVPLGAGFALSSLATQRFATRHRTRITVTGTALMAASLLAVPLVTAEPASTQTWLLATILGFSGVGQGLVVAPLVGTVLGLVPSNESGAGSGIFNTMTQAGMAAGVAILGALYLALLGSNPEAHQPTPPYAHYRHAFDMCAYALAAIAVLTAGLAVAVGRNIGGATKPSQS